MADESKEIPENPDKPQKSPLSSMFDRWQKDTIDSPRNISKEVRREMGNPETNGRIETKEDIVKRLAQGFDHQLRKCAIERYKRNLENADEKIVKKVDDEDLLTGTMAGSDYWYELVHNKKHWQKKELVDTPIEEQYVEIGLTPHSKVSNGQESMRSATTPYGIMPVFFIGSDGKRYQAKNSYELNPTTGEGIKLEQIFESGDDLYGGTDHVNEDILETIDFKLREPYNSRKVPLDGGDFELLKNILSRMESGEIVFE